MNRKYSQNPSSYTILVGIGNTFCVWNFYMPNLLFEFTYNWWHKN